MKVLNYLLVGSFLLSVGCSSSEFQGSITQTESQKGVIGGIEVKPGQREAESTVLLYDKEEKFLCSGTLIDAELVLTAGHCISKDPSQMYVVFSHSLAALGDDSLRPVVSARRHENYDVKAVKNIGDIAIVRFNPYHGLPSGYRPAKLLPDFSVLQEDGEIVAAGYGVNKAWIVKKGDGVLRTTKLKIYNPNFSETEVLVKQSIRRGVCSGDSGGPGYVDINGELYLWGVVSRGDSIPIPLFPDCFLFSVYSRVDSFLPWIQETRTLLMSSVY